MIKEASEILIAGDISEDENKKDLFLKDKEETWREYNEGIIRTRNRKNSYCWYNTL